MIGTEGENPAQLDRGRRGHHPDDQYHDLAHISRALRMFGPEYLIPQPVLI
jgi:hypothetical protein